MIKDREKGMNQKSKLLGHKQPWFLKLFFGVNFIGIHRNANLEVGRSKRRTFNCAQKTFQHWAQQYDRNKEQVCRALSELKKIVMYEESDQN
jgi:hypothetical protein